ncbi:MAG TPA: hypothetical protein P5244_09175, partial [Syntrophales bacterium]|nr:hypothetical protein [Syntrophales bacterium]
QYFVEQLLPKFVNNAQFSRSFTATELGCRANCLFRKTRERNSDGGLGDGRERRWNAGMASDGELIRTSILKIDITSKIPPHHE